MSYLEKSVGKNIYVSITGIKCSIFNDSTKQFSHCSLEIDILAKIQFCKENF